MFEIYGTAHCKLIPIARQSTVNFLARFRTSRGEAFSKNSLIWGTCGVFYKATTQLEGMRGRGSIVLILNKWVSITVHLDLNTKATSVLTSHWNSAAVAEKKLHLHLCAKLRNATATKPHRWVKQGAGCSSTHPVTECSMGASFLPKTIFLFRIKMQPEGHNYDTNV